MGLPTEESWPGVSSLPGYQALALARGPSQSPSPSSSFSSGASSSSSRLDGAALGGVGQASLATQEHNPGPQHRPSTLHLPRRSESASAMGGGAKGTGGVGGPSDSSFSFTRTRCHPQPPLDPLANLTAGGNLGPQGESGINCFFCIKSFFNPNLQI